MPQTAITKYPVLVIFPSSVYRSFPGPNSLIILYLSFRNQHLKHTCFPFKHHRIIRAFLYAAIRFDRRFGINKHQPVGFLRLVIVQVLRGKLFQDVTKIVEIILNKAFCRVAVTFLNAMYISVFSGDILHVLEQIAVESIVQ